MNVLSLTESGVYKTEAPTPENVKGITERAAHEALGNYLLSDHVKIKQLSKKISALEEGEINEQFRQVTLLNLVLEKSLYHQDYLRKFNSHCEQVIKTLLDAGADPNICNLDSSNDRRNAALHFLIDRYKCIHRWNDPYEGKVRQFFNSIPSKQQKERVIRLIKTLKEKGADLNGLSGQGFTPLQVLCGYPGYPMAGHLIPRKTLPDIARELVSKGADVNNPGQFVSPLHMAVMDCLPYPNAHLDRRLQLIQTLIELGADVNQPAPEGLRDIVAGDTPLHAQVKQYIKFFGGSNEVHIHFLYEATHVLFTEKADINRENSEGHSPFSLMIFAAMRYPDLKELEEEYAKKGGTLSDAGKRAIARDMLDSGYCHREGLEKYPVRELFFEGKRSYHLFETLLDKGIVTLDEALKTAISKRNMELCRQVFRHIPAEKIAERIKTARKTEGKRLGKKKAEELYGNRVQILLNTHPEYIKKIKV